MKKECIIEIIECCKKREDILQENRSMREYNKYYDKMRRCARNLISEHRENELLPYLSYNSISIRFDIATLLFNCYPELCSNILKEISEMTIGCDLPKYLILIKTAARDSMRYGIPKDFP